jgi:hypothetical protein
MHKNAVKFSPKESEKLKMRNEKGNTGYGRTCCIPFLTIVGSIFNHRRLQSLYSALQKLPV